VTIAVLPVAKEQASSFGILRMDDAGRVTGFVEKPKTESELDQLQTPAEWLERRGIMSRGRLHLASMGIYLFNRDVLFDLLMAQPLVTDFGKEIFPRSIRERRVYAHLFDGYWEDLGTVKSYHEANLALASEQPPFDFHAPQSVIYTRMRFLPASRIGSASLEKCLISDGCVIESGARLQRCVVGVRSRIGRGVDLRDTVLIGADRFETDAERATNRERGIPNFTVGDGTVIRRAIVDKDCRIGNNVQLVNRRQIVDEDAADYVIRDGIIVIPRGTIVPDGTII
jgi:glucose-1-phosphate adenylyltransferase